MCYNTSMNTKDYVKASEIQEYVFCKRVWWLRLHGKLGTTEQMRAGTRAHEKMAQQVSGFNKRKIVVLIVLGSVALFALIYFLLRILIGI